MKHIKNINEFNTEFDDHKVGQNVNISNDKNFGKETPTELPLDYFLMPDEDGEVDDDEYYSTSAGRDGLYHGIEPGHNKGLKARNTAPLKMSAESLTYPSNLDSINKSMDNIINAMKINIKNIDNYNFDMDIEKFIDLQIKYVEMNNELNVKLIDLLKKKKRLINIKKSEKKF